jgi:beta-glucanase (GH16 family)
MKMPSFRLSIRRVKSQLISPVLGGVLVFFLLCGGSSVLAVTNLVWSDEFSGSSSNLDSTKWVFETSNGCPSNCGWGNNEKENYTSRTNNAYVANGLLHIIALHDLSGSYPYSSARIKTQNKFSFTYGRVEFRAKLPGNGPYWWPACWLLGTNISSVGWPACGEMDVMESKGSAPNEVWGTIHKDSSSNPGVDQAVGGTFTFSGDGTTNFHTYVLQWGVNSQGNSATISFGVDANAPYETITSWSSSLGAYPEPFNQPFYIIMNMAVGGTFVGSPSTSAINSNSTFPAEMDIDYVRVYQNAQPLQITSVSPTNGCSSGGTTITISGSNFLTNTTVTVGGVAATSIVFVNTNTLTAITPANSSGPMNVAVSAPYIGPSGTTTTITTIVTSTLTNGFSYLSGLSFAGLSSATPGAGGATLTWSAASGQAPFTYNVFEASTSGGENFGSPILTTNSLSAFITPLSVGSNCSTTYYFIVRAVDGCGTSDTNTVEQAVQLTAPRPAFAGLGGITPAIEAATLNWSAASGISPLNYNVYEATTSGGENFASPTLTTNGLSTFVSLYPGSNSPITYFFIVRALDGCGNIDSNVVEQSVRPLLDPTKSQVGDGIPNGWKQQYGFNPFDPTVANADPDGDGMSNLQEYLAGTDPTNGASFFHIISVAPQGNDMLITWMSGGGVTNVVQATTNLALGYSDISTDIVTAGTGTSLTNSYVDPGGATNNPNQYYRIRLGP